MLECVSMVLWIKKIVHVLWVWIIVSWFNFLLVHSVEMADVAWPGNIGIRVDGSKRSIAVLKKDNYKSWSLKLKHALKIMKYWKMVTRTIAIPPPIVAAGESGAKVAVDLTLAERHAPARGNREAVYDTTLDASNSAALLFAALGPLFRISAFFALHSDSTCPILPQWSHFFSYLPACAFLDVRML